jgi:hypothetical protein
MRKNLQCLREWHWENWGVKKAVLNESTKGLSSRQKWKLKNRKSN